MDILNKIKEKYGIFGIRNKSMLFIILAIFCMVMVNSVSAAVSCSVGNYENQTFGILWEMMEETECHEPTIWAVFKIAIKWIVVVGVVGFVLGILYKVRKSSMKDYFK